MNQKDYEFQVLNLKISQAISLIKENREIEAKKNFTDSLPAWVDLETAVKLKTCRSIETYRSKIFLQPCCGTNYKLVGGIKSWEKADVLEWLKITDNNLKSYADRFGVKLPANYAKRSQE